MASGYCGVVRAVWACGDGHNYVMDTDSDRTPQGLHSAEEAVKPGGGEGSGKPASGNSSTEHGRQPQLATTEPCSSDCPSVTTLVTNAGTPRNQNASHHHIESNKNAHESPVDSIEGQLSSKEVPSSVPLGEALDGDEEDSDLSDRFDPVKSSSCCYGLSMDLRGQSKVNPMGHSAVHRTRYANPAVVIYRIFERLQNEEELGESSQAVPDAPPSYSSLAADNAAYFDYKDESGFPNPPSYNVATTLPSYDEAERTKAEATIPLVSGRFVSLPCTAYLQHRERLDTLDYVTLEEDDFVARDDFDDADQLRIGNDGIFMLTFFMAFLFNWIGFFLSFCLTTSAAGRYGAISGFGLSLIKWILIVRFSTYFPGYFDGQYWLWWVFLVLGFLLFLRGFINYAKVRKMSDSFSTLPRTRVLFIY
ncbi:UNVERIFIED_CONTAM: hypothetical protein FKN15_016082 [Acipenser sinensis]